LCDIFGFTIVYVIVAFVHVTFANRLVWMWFFFICIVGFVGAILIVIIVILRNIDENAHVCVINAFKYDAFASWQHQ
jgi:hypothetical protein